MSDDRQRPDETRRFAPFGDDGDESDEDSPPGDSTVALPDAADDTRPIDPAGDDGPGAGRPDSTAVLPDGPVSDGPGTERRRDPTAVLPGGPVGDDRPRVAGRPDPTAVLPGAGARDDATAVVPGAAAGAGAWAGRAEVRAPRPGVATEYREEEWPAGPVQPGRRWWLPILVGIVILLLLALIGVGVWLIVRASGAGTPTPAVTASAATPPSTAATTATTTPPTTAPTTTQPTGPTEVAVPVLVGQSVRDAEAALQRKGLTYRLIYRSSLDAEPGTVIDSDPVAGRRVPPDTEVTLVVAAPPRTAPTSASAKVDED
jgi:PASTA domain